MKKLITSVLLAASLILTGCKTTQTTRVINPDGTTNIVVVKVPDVARTKKVEAVATTFATSVMRHALNDFPKETDTIATYLRAVGGVFCEMQFTKQFSPADLEAGIAALVLPHVENQQILSYIQDGRDALRLTYTLFWEDRFTAELPEGAWESTLANIFCDSIDRALLDSGRAGVKLRVGTFPSTAPTDAGRLALMRASLRYGTTNAAPTHAWKASGL